MPLRDHFRPPVLNQASWEGFHALWPSVITLRLNQSLPAGFRAEPRVHLGTIFEVDVGGYELDAVGGSAGPDGGKTATLAAPQPTLSLVGDLARPYEYEVRLYDETRGRSLVAAVEFVSPGNKDRPDARRQFAAKCATLVREGVCVLIVDIVTARSANLYAETLEQLGGSDPVLGIPPPTIYAATVRSRWDETQTRLDAWVHALEVGNPLPTLPLWLTDELWIPLELEAAYEETCRGLGIP